MKKMNPTSFQIDVWNQIKKIPKGETRSYKEIAIAIGNPKAFRAVANACGKNPNPIIVPCHRVIASNGSIGGYTGLGGMTTKRRLLANEGVIIE
jgi:methylated-DNA-[protein]-cysteine S-methyltransferase